MDGIANLYEALSTQFDLGTLNEFRTKIANEQHRRNLYDAVSEQFDLGVADYAGFSAKIDGYLRQPRSVVPDFLTNGQHTQGRTFAEWQMAHASQQAMREHGTVSDAEARRAFQQVHERGERETHELRYKNGPDGKPKDSYIEDLGAGLMAGLGGVAQLPYKAVGAFEDWGSGIMNKATFGLIQPTNGNGIGRRFVNEVLGGNYFRERTEHYRKESDRYQDGRGIVDAAIDGDWSGALGRLGISTVQNAPNLAISIYLSAMGAPELAAETLGAGAAFDKWEEIQHDDSLSDDDKGVAVLGTFLAEYVFEKIGDVRYQKMFQQGSTAQVRREVVRSARSAWDRMMNSKFAHGLGTVWNKVMKFGGESITEMATDISEQAIDVYLGKQDSIDWRQVGDAGIVALASDGPLQGVHWAVDTHQRRKLTAEIVSNPELTAAAQAQGVAPDQMADLLVRAGHGEEMEEADFNALQNYLSAVQEITAQNAEQTAEEQTAEEPEQTETTPANEEQTEETGTIEGKQETARAATLLLDGAETPIAFSGAKVVYNEDGSIDREHSSKIFLQDSNGNLILGDQHEAMLEALDNALRQEKKNGDALMRQDVPVIEEPVAEASVEETRTPEQIAADEAAAQEQAEETRIQEMSAGLEQQLQEKGDKVMDSWNAEEQFVYTMTHSSMEDALSDAREALETAKADKNPTRRRKRMQDIQAVIDHYAPQQQEESTVQPLNGTADGQIRPIGIGDFGPIYDQFRGKPQEAIAFLLEKQDGECLGALSHSDIGPIDLVWGYEGTGDSDGFGLAKLVKFHPEVLDNLQGILDEMHVTLRSENRIQLESERYKAGVRLTWNNESKTWLLTAFEKVEHEENNAPGKTTDTAETAKSGEGNDTPLPQSIVSGDKGTTKNPDTQISGEENAEKVDLSAENVVLMYNGNRSNYVFCRKGEDGTLVRLDTGKPLELTRNGKDTAWQEIGKRKVRTADGKYYILSTLNEKDLQFYNQKGGMIKVMPVDNGGAINVPIADLSWEDGTPVYKRSSDRRNPQFAELKKTAKNLDDIADYVVLDYTKNGVKVEVTLRDLLHMFSTVDEDMNRIYVGDKRYVGIIDKLLSDMGNDTEARASVEDMLNDRVKEAAVVWNTIAEEGESVKETQSLPKKIRAFIDVLDKRGWVDKADYFAGRVKPKKRAATEEDIARHKELREAMKDVETMAELEEIQKEIAALREQAEFNIGETEINEEAGMRTIGYLREAGIAIKAVSIEEAEQMISDEKAEQMRTSGGVLYGFTKDGEIYVISGRLNPTTPVHEYTHLWAKAFARKNSRKWADIVKVLKQTEQWQEVIDDANYADIKENENAVASEVLARLSGEYWGQIGEDGKSKMDEAFEKKALLARVRTALRSFWKQVGAWLGKKINLRQDDADAQLQTIIRQPIQDLIGLQSGGTDLHISEKSSIFAPEMQNELALDRYESRITGNGETVAERRQTTDSGLLEDAQRHLARRDGDAHQVSRQGTGTEEDAERRNAEDATALEQFAKERGQWVEDIETAFTERYGTFIGHGSESFVWRKDDDTVIKSRTIDPKAGGYATIQEALESIAIHNRIFPETAMKVVGFGMDEGELNILFEQPYIEMDRYAEPEEIQQFVSENFGAVKDESVEGGQSYKTAAYLLQDLKPKNVIVKNIDGKDQLFVIDGDFYYTPEHRRFLNMPDGTAPDALFDGDDYHIGDPNPRNISQEVRDAMEQRSRAVAEKNENVHTTPAERLEGTAKLIYQLFDNTHGLYLLQKKINAWRRAHGKAPLPDGHDVRSLLNRSGSAVASRITLFDQREGAKLKEVADKIVAKISKSGLMTQFKQDLLEEERADGTKFHYEPTAQDLVERYLVARDNIERAELGIPTRGEREFTERMGMSMADYATLFQEQLTDEELNEFWRAVRACTNRSISELLRGERISEEEYDTYMRRQFYVPEKDFAERETNEDLQDEEDRARQGGRNRQATAVAHKAEGGNSLATNILANIVHDTKNSIAVAEENLVRKAMFDLMQDNLDYVDEYGLPRPAQVWYVRTGTTEDGEPIYERRLERPSQDMIDEAALIRNLIAQQQERLKDETDTEKRRTIRAAIESLRGELPIVSAKQANDSHQIADARDDVPRVRVYVDGVQYEMTFDGMQEVADALNGVYDLRGNSTTIRKANALVASLFTTYNPTFFAVNLARDTPYIVAKGYSQYGFEFVGKFTKALTTDGVNTRKPIVQYLSGHLNENTPEGRLFYNFLMGGGNTGYTQIQSIREIKKAFEESSFGKTKIGELFDIGAKLNEYSELLTRFAAYKAVLECGFSENEALNAAKNLSVNFNRRGAGQKFLNYFNSLSMFSNAAIQGATGFFRAFDNGKNASRALFGLVFMPAFLGFLNTLLCPDDDDDEYVVSDFYRDNYCVIGAIKIPLPEQFRPFWAMGVNIAMGMQGRRNGGQIAKSLSQSFTQYLLPVPPAVSQALMKTEGAMAGEDTGLGDAADVISTLMLPQFASGVSEIANNKDFMGNTIRKYDLGAVPQYKLGEREAALYQDIAKFFYWANGGDTQVPLKYKKGSIDEEVGRWYVPLPANVNPKEVHKGLGTVIPAGWLNIACSIYGFGKAAATGDNSSIRAKDIPLVGTFYRPEDETMFRYALYKEMKRVMTDYDGIKKEVVKQYAGGDEESREAIEREVISKMTNATDRGFNPQYWEQLLEAYKATSVYDIAHKLGKTEEALRAAYPELESLDDFQKMIGQLMNQELMEYHGIEHHVPWLQEQLRFKDKK